MSKIIKNDFNYRCKDKNLLELLNDLREMINYSAPTDIINNYVKNKLTENSYEYNLFKFADAFAYTKSIFGTAQLY